MWSVLDLMGPILGHTPCLWHLTHHSSCRFRRSQAQKSSAQQGATEAVRGNRAQRKKMYLDDDDLQGRIPKESLTRLLLCFQQVPPLSTLIYGQICHEGYQLLGPCQSSSGNGIKTFLHPRRGSECQEHVFPWSTQIIHVFLVGVCMHHLDAEQKKHVHLIEESKSQNPNYCMVSFVFFQIVAPFQGYWKMFTMSNCQPCHFSHGLGNPSWAAWEEHLPATERLHHLRMESAHIKFIPGIFQGFARIIIRIPMMFIDFTLFEGWIGWTIHKS